MLHETNITFDGCRIWLDGDTKRELKRSIAKLEHWIEEFIANPPRFSTVGVKHVPVKAGLTASEASIVRPNRLTTDDIQREGGT